MRLLNWNIPPRPRTPPSLDRVIVPLEDAHLHSYAARHGGAESRPEDDIEDVEEESGVKSSEHEATGMLEMSVSEYSIEGLRREIRKGSRGKLTEYERMSLLSERVSRGESIG